MKAKVRYWLKYIYVTLVFKLIEPLLASVARRSGDSQVQSNKRLLDIMLDTCPALRPLAMEAMLATYPSLRLLALKSIVADTLPEGADAAEPPIDVEYLINFSSQIRDRWIEQKAKAISPGAVVLDAGAGECRYRQLFQHVDYRTQDFAQYEGTRSGLQSETWDYGKIDYVSDITAIPVADESFDLVLCTEVLEHVPEPISAIRELARTLRKGGSLLLTAPLGSGLHQQPFHYYGGYTPHFYQKYLEENGLQIVEILPIGGLLKHVAQEVHRVGRAMGKASSDALNLEQKYILMDWLPRYLCEKDSTFFVEEFTVGYMVEARKL